MSNEMKIGMFFIIGMIILGVLTFYAGGIEDWFTEGYNIRGYFNKVDGLAKEDIVTLAGVEVGRVKDMRVTDDRVEVVMSINKGAVLREDSVARIESESLLGGKYIGVTVGKPGSRELGEGDVVKTREAADLAKALQDVAEVSADLREMVRTFNQNQEKIASQVNTILGENRENINATFETLSRILVENEEGIKETVESIRQAGPQMLVAVETVNEMLADIEAGEGTIGKLMKDDVLYSEMVELAMSLREASDTTTRILSENEEDIKTMITSLSEAGPKLEQSLTRIDNITKKIEAGEGTLGKLVQDDTLYKEATRTAKEARHAAEDVREQMPIITFTSVLFGAFQ